MFIFIGDTTNINQLIMLRPWTTGWYISESPQQFRKLFGFDMPHEDWNVIECSGKMFVHGNCHGIVMKSLRNCRILKNGLISEIWTAWDTFGVATMLICQYFSCEQISQRLYVWASNDQTNRHVLNWDIPPVKKMMDMVCWTSLRFGCSSQP